MDRNTSQREEKELRTLGRTDGPGEIENLDLPWHQSTWLCGFLHHRGGWGKGYTQRMGTAKIQVSSQLFLERQKRISSTD